MSNETDFHPDELEAIAFVGDTLAPLYLEDPSSESVAPLYAAFSQLDCEQAAADWPFGDAACNESAMRQMAAGLSEAVSEELVWEYRRLFVGPATKAAPPWGSVYTDRDGVIFGISTLDLRAWMRANGVARLTDGDGEPDDHLGLLLLMMAWLARHRPELLREFLELHFLTWSSHYLDKLEQSSDHAFFTGLAVLTRSSLEGIQRAFGIEPEYPRFYR